MIKLAYCVVGGVGLLIAYGLFVLIGSGGDLPDVAQTPPQQSTEQTAPPTDVVVNVATPISILDDTDLSSGTAVALMLFGVGPSGQTLIVTDTADLVAARDTLIVPAQNVGARTNVMGDNALAAFYRDDRLEWVLTCAQTVCGPDTENTDTGITGVPASAFAAVTLDAAFGDHAEYTRFVNTLPDDPFLQLLDLRPTTDFPEPARMATMDLSLPTIVRPAAQPLDIETHGAVLTALLTDLLPDGAALDSINLSAGAPAQLIDRDSSRTVTANGVPITLPTHLFHSTDITVTGVAQLSDDTLAQISDQTRLQADWDADATALMAGLNLPCADCYTMRPPITFEDAATITSQAVPTYLVRYYDLREAP